MFTRKRLIAIAIGLVTIGATAGLAAARGGVVGVAPVARVGGGGGGRVAPVGGVAPPVLGVGGGAGTVNVIMTPTTPFGPLNEDPTFAGGALRSAGTMRFTPNQGILRIDLTNMDPARFPNVGAVARGGGVVTAPSVCIATMAIGSSPPTNVPVTAAVAPATGSAVTLKVAATTATAAKATGTIDIACTFVDAATKTTVTHQTHWIGTMP